MATRRMSTRLMALMTILVCCVGAIRAADPPPAPAPAADATAAMLAAEQSRRQDQTLRRAGELDASGARGEEIAVLEAHLERWPNDDLVRQALLSAQIAHLEAQIRSNLDQQVRTQDLIIGDPQYEAARERAAEEVQKRLATVEYFVAQHRYPQAVDACDAILKDHPGHPAVLRIKLNILRLLERTVKEERVGLLKEQDVRHEESMNEVIDHATAPHEKETQARTVLVFAEDVAEAERQKMRLKLQDRIDLIQDGVEVRQVLETLFAVAGINYMVVDSAVGDEKLTIHQVQATIDEVLSIIAKQVNIRFNYAGGSVYVSSGTSSVLETEIIRVDSGLTNVMAKPKLGQLQGGNGSGVPGQPGQQVATDPFAAAAAAGQNGNEADEKSDLEKFLTEIEEGNIIVGWPADGDIYLDKKSNTVFVRSTPSCIVELKRLLKALDYDNVQVLIEARFVEVTDEANREIGTHFITQGSSGNFDYGAATNAGGVAAPPAAPPATPAAGFAGVLTGSGFNKFPDFRVAISALETEGKANTLSEPKILTLNNATGLISFTQDHSYIAAWVPNTQVATNAIQNGTVVNSSTTSYTPQLAVVPDGIELRITPSVARNSDIITLEVTPTVKQLTRLRQQPFNYAPGGGAAPIGLTTEIPEFDNRSLNTRLHVQNGQTIVLGGLIKERKNETSTGLPWLSHVPVLGYLFGTKGKSHDRRHLLIFVTAHILQPDGAKVDDRLRVLRDTAHVTLPSDVPEQVRQYGAAPAKDAAAVAPAGAAPARGDVKAPWDKGRGR